MVVVLGRRGDGGFLCERCVGYGSGLSERSEEDDDDAAAGQRSHGKAFGPLGLGTTEKWDTQREAREPCRSAVCSVWCACGLGVSGRAVVQKRTPLR